MLEPATVRLEPVKVRLDPDLHIRTKRYADQISRTHSEALRRLIERGLDVSATDSYDLAKSLSSLAAAVQQAADRLGAIEADTTQLAGLIPDMKGIVDVLGERSDEASPQVIPFLKMICEVLMASRVLVAKLDPNEFQNLANYTGQQLDMYRQAVRVEAESADSTSHFSSARQEG